MTKLTVRVTQGDIDKGAAGSHCNCPIALAVKRLTGANDVSVNCDDIYFGYKIFPLPPKVSKFILSFDFHQPVKPFQFTIKGE